MRLLQHSCGLSLAMLVNVSRAFEFAWPASRIGDHAVRRPG
jgi:hypothetical protein